MNLTGYDGNFLRAIDRALDINANKRPQNVQEFQKDIAGELTGEEIGATNDNSKDKEKNNKWIIAGLIVILLVALGYGIYYYFGSVSISSQTSPEQNISNSKKNDTTEKDLKALYEEAKKLVENKEYIKALPLVKKSVMVGMP